LSNIGKLLTLVEEAHEDLKIITQALVAELLDNLIAIKFSDDCDEYLFRES
jgi:hypothetical protein